MKTGLFGELYRKYKWYLIVTVPMSIVLGIASMSVIAIINTSVSNGLEQSQYSPGIFAIAVAALFVVGICTEIINARLATSVSYHIQMKMVRQVIDTPFKQLEKIGFPKVIATLTEDMSTAVKYFHVLPMLFINTAMVLSGLAYMAYLSVSLLAVVAAFFGIGALTIGGPIWLTKKDRVAIREASDYMLSHYQNVVNGAKELALNTPRSEFITQKIVFTARDVRRRANRVLSALVVVEQWGQLLVFSMLGFITYACSDYLTLSKEIVIGYVLTLLFLLEPIEKIVGCFDEVLNAIVAFKKIESLKLAKVRRGDEVKQWYQPEKNEHIGSELRLDNVEYVYKEENAGGQSESFVLGPISTCFRPGEATFIIGGNGSGKSTLIKLIAGLYRVTKGTISFNNQPVSDANIEQYRNYFSLVMPDFCLFEDVLDRQGRRPSDIRINSILGKLRLSSVVTSKKSRLSNLDLSHGQRKRLALLQAYLEGKPIILFDEWAADQDPGFKKLFYHSIVPALKLQGKIVIVITHDEKYFLSSANRVLKIVEGKQLWNREISSFGFSYQRSSPTARDCKGANCPPDQQGNKEKQQYKNQRSIHQGNQKRRPKMAHDGRV